MANRTNRTFGDPRAARWPRAWIVPFVAIASALAAPAPSRAMNDSLIVATTPTSGADSYLNEDNDDEKNGDKAELRLKSPKSNEQKNKFPVVLVNLPAALAGKTVLQAWLSLAQSSASDAVPVAARVHALTQSWSDPEVTWIYRNRASNLLWTTPGGTRLPHATGRQLVSTRTNSTDVRWQVGPIVNDWHLGLLANQGLVIACDRDPGSDEHEILFRSREYTSTPGKTPKLIIQYTNEPPAIQRGYAELQPDSLLEGLKNAPIGVWLDVRAADTTASGTTTGFDEVTLAHGGTLRGVGVDSVIVGGASVAATVTDNGTSTTIRMPKVRMNGRVRIALRADVLASASSVPLEIPVYVDDTTTPGAGRQILWPRDADGVAGNGDSWMLTITAPTNLYLLPSTVTMVNRTCITFTAYAQDASGTMYVIDPDTLYVYHNPSQGYPARGTITQDGVFCATQAGTTYPVVGYRSAPPAYAQVTITPALTPSIASITLRNRAGAATTTLVPQDTMLVDVSLSDGNGFRDITGLDFDLSFAGHAADAGAPAFRGIYRWRRGAATPFTVLDPVPSSWKLAPALCSVDTTTNATTPVTVRLAFLPGAIARASSTGQWSIRATATSATPLDTTSSTLTGLHAATRLTVAWDDSSGAFSAGPPGATLLPLRDPANGKLDARVLANTAYSLEAAVSNFAGLTTTSDTIRVGSPTQRVSWAFTSDRTTGGRLDTSYGTIASAQPASVSETPIAQPLFLWMDLPSPVAAQDYRGLIRIRLASGGIRSSEPTAPLTATVSSSGAAAQSALGEVLPHAVQVGVAAQTFTAYLLPTFGLFDSGIDRIRVSVPEEYGTPVVTSVRVAGSSRSFSDASQPGIAEARLSSNLSLLSQLVEVRFEVATPTTLDPLGSDFVIQFDDLGTSRPPQLADPGDANGTATDGNHWRVTVGPGPIATVRVEPDSTALFPGENQLFTASAADAYGHPLTPAFTWTVAGSAGTVNGSGLFTATAVGSAHVVASSGGVSDSARVIVRPERGVHIVSHSLLGPLYQGQDSAVVRVVLANLGADSVRLDTLGLRFTRVASGDADGDFSTSLLPGAPGGIGGLDTVTVSTRVRVHADAITGSVSIDARAVATELASGVTLRDDEADAPITALVAAGGISLTAGQVPATLLPRARNVSLFTIVLTNHYPEARTVRSLRLANGTTGPGNQDQRDAELGELSLVKDQDGNGVLSPGDEPVLSTFPLSGAATFTPFALTVPAGATARLLVLTSVPLDARDGDALDLSIPDSTSLEFDRSIFYRTGWPLSPAGSFLIDGMSAEQIAVEDVSSANLLAGSANNLALRIVVPPNGYEADLLQRLAMVNTGTAEPSADIERMRAWVDDGDKAFDPALDILLGDLVFTGDRWQRTGLVRAIPLEGLRLFVTVDLSDLARQGRTVQLAIPSGLDAGIGVQSGNSGPRDRPVQNSSSSAVSTVDRITLTSASVDSTSVRPGDRGVTLHHLIATNSYTTPRTLTSLAFTNATMGPGTVAERDGEIEAATLRWDADADGALDDGATDPVLGTSFFSGGRAAFTGLSATIPPGATVHFFLTADVAHRSARDGDVLSALLAGPDDVGFLEGTTLTAAWPVDSRARAAVDGMIASQVTNLGAPGVTLGPGDGPTLALNVVVPANGYARDILRSLWVANLGSATVATGIDELRLWADGGDGVFSAGGGDDRDLNAMTFDGGVWKSVLLADTLAVAGQRFFVSLRTSPSPSDSVTVRLRIPFGGITVESGNDGPIDATIENAPSILISTAPLLATIETGAPSSTVGQSITVRMIVRNAGSEPVASITPVLQADAGTTGAVLDAGPTPPSLNLAPAGVDTFTWVYHSTADGTLQFSGDARGTGTTSGLLRRAVTATSNPHRVYLAAADLALFPVQSMPFNVTRGQDGVVPFSLTLTNGGGAGASDIRLRSFRIRLEDETGAGLVPAELLTGVAVNEGTNVYLTRSTLETTGSEVDLTLAAPLLVTSQEPVTISVRLDISDSTTTPAFRVVLVDSTTFLAEDATSGAPVTVRREGGAFPVLSGLARLVADATELRVESVPLPPARVARGTDDVTLATLRLENPGLAGITSAVEVSEIGVLVADSSGAPVAQASSWLSRLLVRTAFQTLASRPVPNDEDASVTLVLSPPLSVPAGSPIELTLAGDIADTARIGTFRVLLQPPSTLEARDANSRDSVSVSYASNPIGGPLVQVEAETQAMAVRGTPLLPSSVLAGERDVAAMRVRLRHPVASGTGRVRLDSLIVQVRDETRAPAVPDVYLDRLRVLRDGTEIANLTGLPASGGVIPVSLGGSLLEPGDTASILLIVDFSPSAPASFLELAIGATGIRAADANTGRPIRIDPEPGTELPIVSGLTRISSPARDLFVGLQNRMPAALAVDGRPVDVALLTLRNGAGAGSGTIRIDHLRLRAADPGFRAIAVGAAARSLAAYVNGVLWASSDSLGVDSTEVTLVAAAPLEIEAGESVPIELRLVPPTAPSAASFRLGLDASGVGVIQPGSALLTVQVSPEPGSSFPAWTASGSFTPASLAASWANFPNPFAAGREATSFVYYLTGDAEVTLRIWTANGDGVATVLDRASRAPGLHQDDVWNGRNGRGDVVRNGVYVAELIVQYASGTTERARRKVAVVR